MGTKTKKPNAIQAIRDNLRQAAADSGMTQQEIGEAMGVAPSGARQSVSRLLCQTPTMTRGFPRCWLSAPPSSGLLAKCSSLT